LCEEWRGRKGEGEEEVMGWVEGVIGRKKL
jgi:hypothetical protein